eukprot:1153702-Pleurochrysis_carterae.AAC.1
MAAQRIPALGLRFSAPENREDLATRHALWREELSNANNVPNACAGSSHRWEPAKPTQPHYLSGDIKSRTALEEYERQKNHERIRLDTQVVQREYDILHDKLLRYAEAQTCGISRKDLTDCGTHPLRMRSTRSITQSCWNIVVIANT